MPLLDCSLPKAARILEREKFKNIMKAGTKVSGSSIVIFYRLKTSGITRLGITVSKKHGKAHDRNYFKRLVREAFRLCRQELPSPFDLNIQPSGNKSEASHKKRAASLSSIIHDFLQFSQKMKVKEPL